MWWRTFVSVPFTDHEHGNENAASPDLASVVAASMWLLSLGHIISGSDDNEGNHRKHVQFKKNWEGEKVKAIATWLQAIATRPTDLYPHKEDGAAKSWCQR